MLQIQRPTFSAAYSGCISDPLLLMSDVCACFGLEWSVSVPGFNTRAGPLVLKSFRIISMLNFASVLPRPCSPTLLVQVTRTRSPGCVRRGCLGAALELKTAPGSISISFIPFPFTRKNLCAHRIPSLSRLCPIGKNQSEHRHRSTGRKLHAQENKSTAFPV